MPRLHDPYQPALTFEPVITPRSRQRLYRALDVIGLSRQAKVDWVAGQLGGDRVLGAHEISVLYRALRSSPAAERDLSEGERLSYHLAGI